MPDFEILEHTADIGIRVHGDTVAALFAAAALSLQSVSLHASSIDSIELFEVSVTGEDREALLVNWLNEIIYLLDGKRVAIGRIHVKSLTDFEVIAAVWVEPLNLERHHVQLVVKAATYHQLKIFEHENGWTAEIFLDI